MDNLARDAIQALVARPITFRELSKLLGVNAGTLSDVARGQRVSRRTMRKLRRALGLENVQETPPHILAWQVRNRQ